jgi:hypothetical protein
MPDDDEGVIALHDDEHPDDVPEVNLPRLHTIRSLYRVGGVSMVVSVTLRLAWAWVKRTVAGLWARITRR